MRPRLQAHRVGEPVMTFDLIIRGATIIDGTGQPGYTGDVALSGQRIAALGQVGSQARRTVEAAGLVVFPGLIDPHSHADLIFTLPAAPQAHLLRGKIAQGITTTLVGNCGLGVAPFETSAQGAILSDINNWMSPANTQQPWPWRSIGDYLSFISTQGPALNVGTLVPHGAVRISEMGLAKGAPTQAKLRLMQRAVDRSLREGAFGLSTGLIYPPGMFSSPDELTALGRVAARHDRIYTSHIRGSSETLIPAVRELITIGRTTGVRVHHSHNEAVGRAHWSKIDRVLKMEEAAVADGVRLSFDIFPYTAAATMMIAIYPPWALEGGVGALVERLRDPRTRRQIGREIEHHRPTWPPWRDGGWPHNLVRATGWESIRIGYAGSSAAKRFEGLSLAELGEKTGQTPFNAISDLVVTTKGEISMLIFDVSGPEDSFEQLARLVRHPLCSFCTDADDYGHGRPHPAAYGAFPRLLSRFRDQPLETLIHRMTLLPARTFGIANRGVIRPGAFADLVLADPALLRDRATYRQPRREPTGIEMVIINGAVALDAGQITPARGLVLRR